MSTMAGKHEVVFADLISGVLGSASRLKMNMESIIQKYDRDFPDDDHIHLHNMEIVKKGNNGEGFIRKIQCRKFGATQLKSTKRKDTLMRSWMNKQHSKFDPNVSMSVARECESILGKNTNNSQEPSDAETLSSDGEDNEEEESNVDYSSDEDSYESSSVEKGLDSFYSLIPRCTLGWENEEVQSELDGVERSESELDLAEHSKTELDVAEQNESDSPGAEQSEREVDEDKTRNENKNKLCAFGEKEDNYSGMDRKNEEFDGSDGMEEKGNPMFSLSTEDENYADGEDLDSEKRSRNQMESEEVAIINGKQKLFTDSVMGKKKIHELPMYRDKCKKQTAAASSTTFSLLDVNCESDATSFDDTFVSISSSKVSQRVKTVHTHRPANQNLTSFIDISYSSLYSRRNAGQFLTSLSGLKDSVSSTPRTAKGHMGFDGTFTVDGNAIQSSDCISHRLTSPIPAQSWRDSVNPQTQFSQSDSGDCQATIKSVSSVHWEHKKEMRRQNSVSQTSDYQTDVSHVTFCPSLVEAKETSDLNKTYSIVGEFESGRELVTSKATARFATPQGQIKTFAPETTVKLGTDEKNALLNKDEFSKLVDHIPQKPVRFSQQRLMLARKKYKRPPNAIQLQSDSSQAKEAASRVCQWVKSLDATSVDQRHFPSCPPKIPSNFLTNLSPRLAGSQIGVNKALPSPKSCVSHTAANPLSCEDSGQDFVALQRSSSGPKKGLVMPSQGCQIPAVCDVDLFSMSYTNEPQPSAAAGDYKKEEKVTTNVSRESPSMKRIDKNQSYSLDDKSQGDKTFSYIYFDSGACDSNTFEKTPFSSELSSLKNQDGGDKNVKAGCDWAHNQGSSSNRHSRLYFEHPEYDCHSSHGMKTSFHWDGTESREDVHNKSKSAISIRPDYHQCIEQTATQIPPLINSSVSFKGKRRKPQYDCHHSCFVPSSKVRKTYEAPGRAFPSCKSGSVKNCDCDCQEVVNIASPSRHSPPCKPGSVRDSDCDCQDAVNTASPSRHCLPRKPASLRYNDCNFPNVQTAVSPGHHSPCNPGSVRYRNFDCQDAQTVASPNQFSFLSGEKQLELPTGKVEVNCSQRDKEEANDMHAQGMDLWPCAAESSVNGTTEDTHQDLCPSSQKSLKSTNSCCEKTHFQFMDDKDFVQRLSSQIFENIIKYLGEDFRGANNDGMNDSGLKATAYQKTSAIGEQARNQCMFPEEYVNMFSPSNPLRKDSDETTRKEQEKRSSSLDFKKSLRSFCPRRNQKRETHWSSGNEIRGKTLCGKDDCKISGRHIHLVAGNDSSSVGHNANRKTQKAQSTSFGNEIGSNNLCSRDDCEQSRRHIHIVSGNDSSFVCHNANRKTQKAQSTPFGNEIGINNLCSRDDCEKSGRHIHIVPGNDSSSVYHNANRKTQKTQSTPFGNEIGSNNLCSRDYCEKSGCHLHTVLGTDSPSAHQNANAKTSHFKFKVPLRIIPRVKNLHSPISTQSHQNVGQKENLSTVTSGGTLERSGYNSFLLPLPFRCSTPKPTGEIHHGLCPNASLSTIGPQTTSIALDSVAGNISSDDDDDQDISLI